MSSEVYDAVVIGGGINGSFAALHLARSGKKTILVEQFPLPHDRGSSCGQARLFRVPHFSPDSFNPILQDSNRKWVQLEKDSNTSFIRNAPVYFFRHKTDQKDFRLMTDSMLKYGITPIVKTGKQLNEDHETNFPEDIMVLEDPGAYILMSTKCLQAVQGLFTSYGGTIIDEYPVTGMCVLEHKNGNVLIQSSKGRSLEAKSVIICAGPWTDKILRPLGINLPLEPIRVPFLYWPILDKSPSTQTFFFLDSCHNDGGSAYGFPDFEYPGLLKMGLHGGESCACDPSFRDSLIVGTAREKMAKYIKQNIPWLGTKPVIEEACMYTMTPDNEMIVDQHPIYKNISFCCGFSGTGFKTAPTVGQIVAELATGAKLSFDISDFRMNRFDSTKRQKTISKL